jgi:tetratricopeptide (TPR) repeat protein
MKFSSLFPFFLVIGLLCTCGRDRLFQESYDRITAEKQGGELMLALESLDQEFPDRLIVKVNLGSLLLASGQLKRANVYLSRAETLVGKRSDRHLKYLLYASLAEYKLRQSCFSESIDYADLALEQAPEDTVGVIFTRAKACSACGQRKQALTDFAQAHSQHHAQMNLEDYCTYIHVLTAEQSFAHAIDLYRERQRRFGYLPGQGLEESVLFERTGRIDEAVLSAFMELEYQRSRSGVQDDKILENLNNLEKNFQNPHVDLLEGLRCYVEGNWQRAVELFGCFTGSLSHPFGRYLLLASTLERGAPIEDMNLYADLETDFRDFQYYYYHLWRGMRKGSGHYSFATVRVLLEKTILLAPGSEAADESRIELGRLIGLSPAEAGHLLLKTELDMLLAQVVHDKNPDPLGAVMHLLSIPDNIYTASALLELQELISLPFITAYLEEQKNKAEGRLKERLTGLLGS